MRTNNDARVWCSENYDTNKESFYIYNAKKLIFEEWRTSWKHAIVSIVLVVVAGFMGWISNPLLWLAAMQVGFAFYGILTYCHNDQGAGCLAYVSTLIFFLNALKEGHPVLKVLFIVVGLVLLGASVITEKNYKQILGSYATTAKRQWANDEEEFEAWKNKYYHGYSRDAYSNADSNNSYQEESQSSAQRATNKYAEQARTLFADFGSTLPELKKRYRKLAMQHHPDHGGEHDMFVAIVSEYEYLKDSMFPGQK